MICPKKQHIILYPLTCVFLKGYNKRYIEILIAGGGPHLAECLRLTARGGGSSGGCGGGAGRVARDDVQDFMCLKIQNNIYIYII